MSPTDKKVILVIDDEQSVRHSFELALKESAYDIRSVSSGEEGLKSIAEKKYQLIFLDLNMPGMSGINVLEKIQEQKPNIPIYIVTAFHKAFLTDLQEAKAKGLMFQIFKKPIGSAGIRHLVESVLGKPTFSEEIKRDMKHTLRLYVAGVSETNQSILEKFKLMLIEKLGNKFTLEIIDIFEQPELTDDHQIIATPTIVHIMPDRVKKVILDFSSEEKILIGMDVLFDEK